MSMKRRKSVKCTMCTPDRWKGNAKDRLKPKQANQKIEARKEIREDRE